MNRHFSVFLVQRGEPVKNGKRKTASATCAQWLCSLPVSTTEVRFCWLSRSHVKIVRDLPRHIYSQVTTNTFMGAYQHLAERLNKLNLKIQTNWQPCLRYIPRSFKSPSPIEEVPLKVGCLEETGVWTSCPQEGARGKGEWEVIDYYDQDTLLLHTCMKL